MQQQQGAPDQIFDEAYDKALLRKRLFKVLVRLLLPFAWSACAVQCAMRPQLFTAQDYLSRHQVLERFNIALEKLFDCPDLPEVSV